MGSIATRRTTRCISRPPSFIIPKNCKPRWRRVVSGMKGRCLSKGHYGFHTMWSRTSRTRSGANNFWRSHVGSKRNRLCLVPAHICWWLHAKPSHQTHAHKTLHLVSCPSLFHSSPPWLYLLSANLTWKHLERQLVWMRRHFVQ